MALGSTQPLTEMSARNISWEVKPVRRADNLHVPIVLKSGSLNLLESSGSVEARNGIGFSKSDNSAVLSLAEEARNLILIINESPSPTNDITGSSETSVNTPHTVRCHYQEDSYVLETKTKV